MSQVTDKTLLEFLPAALEVEQTPASPVAQAMIWSIVLLLVIAVVWACVGKIDIVAVAQGRIIPSGHSKQIQPLEAGKISAIHVTEGQKVHAGQTLIELDTTQAQADLTRIRHELQQRQAEQQRQAAFEHWFALPDALVEATQLNSQQEALLHQQVSEIRARLASFNSEIAKLQAEQAMTQAEIEKKRQVLPVLKERVDALDQLQQKKLGSRVQYLELKQTLIEQQQDLAIQQANLQQTQAAIQSAESQRESLLHEQRKQNLTQWQETQLQIATLQQEQIKAETRLEQQSLTAPIAGQVQQLAVHTLGGVVTPAQPLMVIVPESSQLEVEALVLNKDIGFVREGQPAEVKIDTFNFTKYGYLDAEITTLSDDAIQDEKLGLVYSARLRLKQDTLNVEGKPVKLSPGMTVVSEIKTGQRRMIEFFLSPLLRYKQESLGER
ncbi:MAG: HlyD family type I secretion periplasmic adaptor subunit [Hahellaceae bacterium]|nr:HlyD family type I secretion periplasmic adaptor subunit [Hahellaceae bacterium]